MERVTGIEPVSTPWQGVVLPMYYTRLKELGYPTKEGSRMQAGRLGKNEISNSIDFEKHEIERLFRLRICAWNFLMSALREQICFDILFAGTRCGIRTMVVRKLPKLETRVRFSYPAPRCNPLH